MPHHTISSDPTPSFPVDPTASAASRDHIDTYTSGCIDGVAARRTFTGLEWVWIVFEVGFVLDQLHQRAMAGNGHWSLHHSTIQRSLPAPRYSERHRSCLLLLAIHTVLPFTPYL